MQSNPRFPQEPSLATLVGQCLTDARRLIREEVALAKLEFQKDVNDGRRTVYVAAMGYALTGCGVGLTALTLVSLLILLELPYWLAFLLSAGLFAMAGIGLLLYARQHSAQLNFIPEKTLKTLREDVACITKTMKSKRFNNESMKPVMT